MDIYNCANFVAAPQLVIVKFRHKVALSVNVQQLTQLCSEDGAICSNLSYRLSQTTHELTF